MRDCVLKNVSIYALIELARYIVKDVLSKNYFQELQAIQAFVKKNIRYTRDPSDLETIAYPQRTLKIKQGDCDDHSILVATLLTCIGFSCRFVAIALGGQSFCHVYVEALDPNTNQWYSVETTEPVEVGWNPKNVTERMVIEI